MAKLSIRDLDVNGKAVLMRVDFNVPLNDSGEITDDTRIVAALPSIKHLLDGGASLTLCSHLGRPKGEPDAKYSLRPAAVRLGELLGKDVAFAESCVGEATKAARAALQSGEVLLLENTRFHSEEKANDAGFAAELAADADVFVNDAFGTAHRAHASTEGVTHHVSQSAMGLLIERELEFLCDKLEAPQKPFLVIMGGAKVSDKIEVITALLEKADTFIIGGAMAYTFRKAQGHAVGDSLVENDKLDLALDILKKAQELNTRFLLPADTRITQEFKDGAETRVTDTYADGGSIPDGWEGIDIGDVAIDEFCAEIANAGTIVWNGPMGVFEIDSFEAGTKAVTEAVAKSDALSIVGGGDSVTAVKKYGLADQVSFISTGGGASLELLEGKELPGVKALSEA
jgi:3-phosphoglycerate kinase